MLFEWIKYSRFTFEFEFFFFNSVSSAFEIYEWWNFFSLKPQQISYNKLIIFLLMKTFFLLNQILGNL